jgi:hypothetical protein
LDVKCPNWKIVWLACIYTGSPIRIPFSLIGLLTNHITSFQYIFFRADLIGERPNSEKRDQNWASCLNAAYASLSQTDLGGINQ